MEKEKKKHTLEKHTNLRIKNANTEQTHSGQEKINIHKLKESFLKTLLYIYIYIYLYI